MVKIDLMSQFLSTLFHCGEFDDIDDLCSLISMIGRPYDQEVCFYSFNNFKITVDLKYSSISENEKISSF